MVTSAHATSVPQNLSSADYRRFRDYFHQHTGIYFEDNKRYFVDKRILERMRQTGHSQFRSYFAQLRRDGGHGEFQQLVNCMTVNETYFMREPYQLQCLVQDVLAERLQHQQPSQPMRIWSMPSSTGEEPYSIALTLLEQWPEIDQVDVEIVASDIDTAALDRARQGIYGQRALMHLDEGMKARYFSPLKDGRWQLNSSVRQAIEFTHVNLHDPQTLQHRAQPFDVVFCRNLLIYFDDSARRRATDHLFTALKPGGFVFLGHSESMNRMSSRFQVRRFDHGLAYQRPYA